MNKAEEKSHSMYGANANVAIEKISTIFNNAARQFIKVQGMLYIISLKKKNLDN